MRLRTLTVVLLALLSMAIPGSSSEKNRDWQTGKLTNVEGAWASGYARCRSWLYSVETETMVYVFGAHTAFCSDHPRPFTVGNSVKFMIEPSGKAFLVDEQGKEFKASLIKKVTKQSSVQNTPLPK